MNKTGRHFASCTQTAQR